MKNNHLLYVDALNYSAQFGFVTKCWGLRLPGQRIKEFVDAAKSSGFTLKVFIDAGIESEEAIDKWKSRREKEVLGEYKDVPQGLSTLVGDIFRLNGVEVAYSPVDADNDDCIAAHAQADGADILSNDKDFFRYIDRKYKLFGEFSIEDGRLILKEKKEPRPNPKFPAPTPKAIIKPPVMLTHDSIFNTIKTMNFYRRGAPSSLVRWQGNYHGYLVDMRSALYAKMGKTEPILEEWPEWDPKTEKVVWHSEKVTPNLQPSVLFVVPFGMSVLASRMRHADVDGRLNLDFKARNEKWERYMRLIRQPIPEFPPGIEDWELYNDAFAQYSLVLELYVAFHDNRDSLYELMLKYGFDKELPGMDEPLSTPCFNWFKDGTCKFGKTCLAGEGGHRDCADFKTEKGCRRGKFCRWRHA